ncbi:DNA mismatch repair endonuclease MutH [Alteromonas sp. a30]|uniref:DNA mismatch repair endonuclease MutH n=1 Tax=Alteromonas sp. a30 TaxID=2730917 RepID=UPI00228233BF|nr:DNA mismatch repair endonuclease MutH [Alteromonas sp. a30]MCY7294274.1 DNA mismatch repair endonuclease MutH [Alteromonas sp. a30]
MPVSVPSNPPQSPEELMQRALSLSGLSLGELAKIANVKVPDNFKTEKGWSGQLIELMLGATAGSKPQQDFPELGIELKTIPIGSKGEPLETTYVCFAPLLGLTGIQWQHSNVYNKLRQVLWLPIQGSRDIPPAERMIGTAFLWQPSQEQQQQLQADWEELMDFIVLGRIEDITARHGEFLQLRPKAANGDVLTDAIGNKGQIIKTRPRGFYLRKQFTQAILEQHFGTM